MSENATTPKPIEIPAIEGSSVYVTYLLDTPEEVRRIAEQVGAMPRESHPTPSIVEYYYAADEHEPERWILVCRWTVGEISCTAQAAYSTEPTGWGAAA